MKPDPNESYESWCNRARMFEHGAALQRIAKGENVDEVLESMSRKLMEKLLHPIYKGLHDQPSKFDVAQSRKSYEERYLNTTAANHADQVDGKIFDKTD